MDNVKLFITTVKTYVRACVRGKTGAGLVATELATDC